MIWSSHIRVHSQCADPCDNLRKNRFRDALNQFDLSNVPVAFISVLALTGVGFCFSSVEIRLCPLTTGEFGYLRPTYAYDSDENRNHYDDQRYGKSLRDWSKSNQGIQRRHEPPVRRRIDHAALHPRTTDSWVNAMMIKPSVCETPLTVRQITCRRRKLSEPTRFPSSIPHSLLSHM